MLTVGGEEFCNEWEANTLIKITDPNGNSSFARYIPERDPNMTVYDDVNQILLNEHCGSQGVRRKLDVGQSCSQSSSKEDQLIMDAYATEGQAESQSVPVKVLDPEEVSKTFSELQYEPNGIDEPDCSAIGDEPADKCKEHEKKPLSSTPGVNKKIKLKRSKAINPDEISETKIRRVDREASDAMKNAADKIMEAATLIVNCMTELRPELKSFSNKNYREIQMSTNAIKQLVSKE